MIVFKTFLKVLKSCIGVVIMYTVILLVFGAFNMQTGDNSINFTADKPDILIVNGDEETGVTKNLIEYMEQNCNIVDVDNNDDAISDALFYRDVSYIIYIPDNYREDFLSGKNPEIEVKSTGDYEASFAEIMLSRYVEVAGIYNNAGMTEEEIIDNINDTLADTVNVEITSKLDEDGLQRASYYYSFASYSLLAGCVYVICLILSSFRKEEIRKRTIVSSANYRKYNIQLLFSNALFAFVLWFLYVLVSFVIVGSIMFSLHGLIYIVNSFIFTFCALTIAFLIGNVMNNKEAINGIVNVIALGSSFLCGAFVPAQWLPDIVLKIAHILPSYYYINTNDRLKNIEVIDFGTLQPVFVNMLVLLGFSVAFVVAANIVSGKKRKIA